MLRARGRTDHAGFDVACSSFVCLTTSPEAFIERGGSAIIAPDGRYLAGPIFEDEVVLTATLELEEIDRESMTLDVSGHYSRPDIFQLSVSVLERK